MSELFAQGHDLLADIRATATLLNGPTTPPDGTFEAGAPAFARGPAAAVFMAALIAARRLDQANRARIAAGRQPEGFPRERLATKLRLRPVGRRRDSKRDSLDYLEQLVAALVTEPPVEQLVATHGYPAFMAMLRLANETGQILVEADPQFRDLEDLFRLEALADETEWQEWLNSSGLG